MTNQFETLPIGNIHTVDVLFRVFFSIATPVSYRHDRLVFDWLYLYFLVLLYTDLLVL